MVRDFQCVIGREAIEQMQEAAGRQPDVVTAAVGGGSNAIGIFHPYLSNEHVRLVGVEAGGKGVDTKLHSASINAGQVGVLHGNRTMVIQDENGQVQGTHSISAGLDYPGVGPEHALLKELGLASYEIVNDDEAIQAFHDCCAIEGIIPALESSHALAYAARIAPQMAQNQIILVNLSGRGDKDIHTVADYGNIQL